MMRLRASILCLLTLTGALHIPGVADAEVCLRNLQTTSTSSVTTWDSSIGLTCDKGGGGGGSYTASWDPNTTYTERNHTLERFANFPVAHTPTGRVNLTSLAYPPPRTFRTDDLSTLTDAAIGQAMGALGLTTQMLSDQLARYYAGDTSQSNRLATAQQNVESGAYLSAVDTIAAVSTNITLWCGDADNPVSYTWVVVIPAVLPCPVDGADRNISVAALVPNAAHYVPIVDPNNPSNIRMVLHELNLTLTQTAPVPQAAARYTVGLQYLDLIWATTTSANKSLSTAVNIRNLEMSAGQKDKLGWVYWNATSGQLTMGDSLTFTHSNRFRQEKNINVTIGRNTTSFGAEYTTKAVGSSWQVWLYYRDRMLVESATVTMTTGSDRTLVLSMANQTNGISFKSAPRTSMGRTREMMTIASAGGAFVDTEIKATYFVGNAAALDFQFKGLPGDETNPGEEIAPARNVLRLDYGKSPQGGNLTFDLTEGLRAAAGYYRAVIVTSRIPEFPFQATASHVDRVYYSGGSMDPWNGTRPYAIHAANTIEHQSNSHASSL